MKIPPPYWEVAAAKKTADARLEVLARIDARLNAVAIEVTRLHLAMKLLLQAEQSSVKDADAALGSGDRDQTS